MNIEIANRLITLRKQYKLSQEDLAERLGISRQAVSRWERAEASPDTDNLINLSKIYNVSVDSLLALDADGEENLDYTTNERARGRGYIVTEESGDADSLKRLIKTIYPAYAPIIVMVYLLLGLMFNLWHPGWLVFMTIPIFYTIVRID
ncbi:MAG: helix-turn-helix domain-containing protein [Clostridiales bacterium]|nr:helix-turn-helix domain-containing protein [Clostridiales bacterium]